MTIQEIVLHPSDQSSLAFQGRLVAEAIGSLDDRRLQGRHHVIRVYEVESGELHLVLEFKTECEHENPHCSVELGIHTDEISEVLLAYDATEHLNRNSLQHRYESEMQQFVKRLHHQYDDLCASIERQMLSYQPPVRVGGLPSGKQANQADRSGWRAWIPLGKPR